MPHQPLTRLLLEAARTARGASRSGVPLLEYAERRRAALDRRRFLKTVGAAAGALLVGGCASQRGSGARVRAGARVIVVGAGVAGLHCAYRLGELGVRADVYEASPRSGGRMLTDRVTFGSQDCELGGELVDTPHRTMHDLAQEFELALADFRTDDPSLETAIAFLGGRRFSLAELLVEFAPIAGRIDAALATLDDPELAVTYRAPNGGAALDRTSIREWLDSIGASGAMRAFLDVAYVTEYGLETDVSSALNLLLMISTDLARFEMFGESDERYRVVGGNDAITAELARRLAPGSLRTGCRLVALRRAADGRLVAAFERDGATFDETAEHVVCAIPFTMLREVRLDLELSDVKRRAIAELDLGMNAKLMTGFRTRVWRAQGSNGEVFTDLPFQCAWETSRLQPGAAGIVTNFTGGEHARALGARSSADQMQAFLGGYERVFAGVGAASNARHVRMHWPSHPLTRGAYASYRVGQYTAFCGAEIERAGNLHFCGEHTSLDAQGFMEGGAATGAMAAAEVAEDLGLAIERSAASAPARHILARASGSSFARLRERGWRACARSPVEFGRSAV